MAGIDPETGEPIYYPGERDSKWKRLLWGSPRYGGGLMQLLPPLCFLLAAIFLAFGVDWSTFE